MITKKFLVSFFIFFFLHSVGLVLGMDPVVQKTELRPVDKIFLAACKNDKGIHQLIKLGANPRCIDPENGYTGLHYACTNGNVEKAAYFLRQVFQVYPTQDGGFCLNLPGANNVDLVSFTRDAGHEEMIQGFLNNMLINAAKLKLAPAVFELNAIRLLKSGADVNAINDYPESNDFIKFTSLHYACFLGQIEKVKFLIDNGADVNPVSHFVSTPLYTLFANGMQYEDESTRYNIAQYLISHGAKIAVKGSGNKTLLQVVVAGGEIESAKMLLGLLKDSDELNLADDKGHNALCDAVRFERVALIPLLFDAGVKPIADIDGFSLMHHAASKGNVRIIEELIARGLDVNALDNEGQNPLHHACEANYFDAVKKLVDAGADILKKDCRHNTPLQLSRDKQIKSFLLKAQKSFVKTKAIEQQIKQQETQEVVQKKEPQKKTTKKKNNKKKAKVSKKPEKVVVENELVSSVIELADDMKAQPALESEILAVEIHEKTATNDVLVADDVPQIKIKPAKKSLLDRVQEKVVDTLIPSKTKKTFAQVLASSQNNQQEQKQTIDENDGFDDHHLHITFQQSRLLTASVCQSNPLLNVSYSPRVCEKKNHPTDKYHNFSCDVERLGGALARAHVLEKSTKKDCDITEYKIPGYVQVLGHKKTVPGTFEFIVKKKKDKKVMIHRFFNPDKEVDKKKAQLMLPAPTHATGVQFPK